MGVIQSIPPVLAALLAGIFTWGVTALGSATVFFFKEINKKVLTVMLGFAAGVMIAASFWSLRATAIAMSEGGALSVWFPALAGFLGWSGFLWLVDKLIPNIHPGSGHEEGIHTSWQRSVLLVLAITFHNIPEGFAVGVAFVGLASGNAGMTL
ncbi:MAG: ZIP family metal transporter, partial [Eubacterium aggregans]